MFPTVALQLAYVSSLIKAPALAHIQPHIENNFASIPDVDSLLLVLKAAYGDRDERGTAERELRALKQRNQDFATYYANFQRIMAILAWDESAMKAALKEGLSNEMKDAMVYIDKAPTLAELVEQLKKLDNKIRARAQESKGSRPTHKPAANPAKSASSSSADHPSFRPGGTVPMALDSARKISQAEKERRMREGLCAYCAGSGQFART